MLLFHDLFFFAPCHNCDPNPDDLYLLTRLPLVYQLDSWFYALSSETKFLQGSQSNHLERIKLVSDFPLHWKYITPVPYHSLWSSLWSKPSLLLEYFLPHLVLFTALQLHVFLFTPHFNNFLFFSRLLKSYVSLCPQLCFLNSFSYLFKHCLSRKAILYTAVYIVLA